MRFIKFRVVDIPPLGTKNRKSTIIGYEVLIEGEWHFQTDGVTWQKGTLAGLHWKRFQDTGTKDRTGVAIYEGDIVNRYGTLDSKNKVVHTGEVQWSQTNTCYVIGDETTWNLGIYAGKYGDNKLEVIGTKFDKLYETL